MADSINILQWNCQGIRQKKDEILEMVQQHSLSILALQETKLWNNSKFGIPHYNEIRRDGHYNVTPHGGVAIYVHESIPYDEITLNTPIQAIAIRANIGRLCTICNLYSSRNHQLNPDLLQQLYVQLPPPVVILGDFNGHNQLWGSAATDARGHHIEQFIHHNSLNILNNGAPTRVAYQVQSAIDISICSPILEPELIWNVSSSPGDSDHCPIVLSVANINAVPPALEARWSIKKADWAKYRRSRAWEELNNHEILDPEDHLDRFYEAIDNAATESIPRYMPTKYYPKPWWTREVKRSKQERERLYQRYRSNRTEQNMLQWKRKRASHKKLVKESKKQCWIDHVSTINCNTPVSSIYEKIKAIKGRKQRKTNILTDNGNIFSTIPQIANKLAETFSAVSNDNNYSDTFLVYKNHAEQQAIDFLPANEEDYNQEFSLGEFESCIATVRTTSPGPDGIYYQMISNMPHAAKLYFLKFINYCWINSFFPTRWNSAIIVPIPKPGKNHNCPSNYRPIALTSCLCKTMERLINRRLIEYLEMNKILTSLQCGCRPNRSTTDHLIRLESEVRKAFATNEHLVSIFFDLEKAYDMTWRHGIVSDLYAIGLRGHLPRFIAAFLRLRTFRVRIENELSDLQIQRNGVAQGSILSVTLFAIKINSVVNHISNDPSIMASLYVDDLQLSCRGPDLGVIGAKLQQCLNKLQDWSNTNGFRFSPTKTKAVHFTTIPGLHNPPELRMTGDILPYVDNIKFLGLTWDTKLTWKSHINQLKFSCSKLLGLLRSVTTQEWGADQTSCLRLFRSLIRSKLDYGVQVYGSASVTSLQSLDSITTEALRIATGAFKSTPTDTLYALANEMPPDIRREFLSLRYYLKPEAHWITPPTTIL